MPASVRETQVPPRIATEGLVAVRVAGGARLRIGDLAGYRPLIRALAIRDLKARYKQAALGPAWVIFQPLALLAAFAVGFNSVADISTGGTPYFLFALAGLSIWTYFQAATMVATGSIVNNYALVRWTACPRLALPLATLVSSLPSFVVTAGASIVATAVTGHMWLGIVLLPALALWLVVLTGAVAVFLAGISVRARDVASITPFLLQVGLFLSPVAYQTAQLPSSLQTLISINPLTGLIDAWRWGLLGISPDVTSVGASLCVTGLLVVLAWRTFSAIEAVMSDEI